MNLADLKKRIEKSREFTFEHNGFTLILRRPTEDEKMYMAPKDREDPRDLYYSAMAHYEKCIKGWQNVKVSDFVDDGTSELVDFDLSLVPELFDRNKGLSEKMISAVYKKSKEHEEKEAEEKKT